MDFNLSSPINSNFSLVPNDYAGSQGTQGSIGYTGSAGSPFTNYFGVISREDFNPYSNIPEQQQRWQSFDNQVRFT